jgi:hypothetical protein
MMIYNVSGTCINMHNEVMDLKLGERYKCIGPIKWLSTGHQWQSWKM